MATRPLVPGMLGPSGRASATSSATPRTSATSARSPAWTTSSSTRGCLGRRRLDHRARGGQADPEGRPRRRGRPPRRRTAPSDRRLNHGGAARRRAVADLDAAGDRRGGRRPHRGAHGRQALRREDRHRRARPSGNAGLRRHRRRTDRPPRQGGGMGVLPERTARFEAFVAPARARPALWRLVARRRPRRRGLARGDRRRCCRSPPAPAGAGRAACSSLYLASFAGLVARHRRSPRGSCSGRGLGDA